MKKRDRVFTFIELIYWMIFEHQVHFQKPSSLLPQELYVVSIIISMLFKYENWVSDRFDQQQTESNSVQETGLEPRHKGSTGHVFSLS